MPTLQENLKIAREVVDEVKAATTSSHDIIKKTELPVFLNACLAFYVNKFGKDKTLRYINHANTLAKLRERSIVIAQQQGATSPIMVAKIATAMHGVGECQELSTIVALKLIERSQACGIVGYLGKQNPYREAGVKFNHAIVLMGNVDLNNLRTLSNFKHQPKEVVVVDAYLGYVGSARNYVRDNQNYIDVFALEHAFGSYSYLGPEEFVYAPTLKAQAAKVLEKFSEEGVVRFQRHCADKVAKLSPEIKKVTPPCEISAYPAFLFHLENSQQQTKVFQASVYSEPKKNTGDVPTGLFSSGTTLCTSQFFSQPLGAHNFKNEATPKFSPMAYI